MFHTLSKSNQHEKQDFDTSGRFAMFTGFLILPVIGAMILLLSALVIVTFAKPSQLEGLHLISYYLNVATIPYLIFAFYAWIKRKRFLPLLMIIFFGTYGLLSIAYTIQGVENEFFNIVTNVIWVVYFVISKRVKATFTE